MCFSWCCSYCQYPFVRIFMLSLRLPCCLYSITTEDGRVRPKHVLIEYKKWMCYIDGQKNKYFLWTCEADFVSSNQNTDRVRSALVKVDSLFQLRPLYKFVYYAYFEVAKHFLKHPVCYIICYSRAINRRNNSQFGKLEKYRFWDLDPLFDWRNQDTDTRQINDLTMHDDFAYWRRRSKVSYGESFIPRDAIRMTCKLGTCAHVPLHNLSLNWLFCKPNFTCTLYGRLYLKGRILKSQKAPRRKQQGLAERVTLLSA
jgi:hypothetical protein